ncbi:clathrin light chain B isoform X2 [Gadus morhua]|uniref:Clathrin light chain n=1 Tax=Gadus morhua TaxID=8049 RepID=A0A8C5AJA1_GADMO|nr:clathrin light chain B-like isoform X2 [Gadus morhua]XP_056456840.1 clathrin light chain B isoform X2 [Gadus chalcogrammus]XP_059918796.1 clathrin light chain B isoform X3 [Gadus macrocephalus]
MADNGVHTTEEDPAAAFLAQQENEIAVIENDDDGFGALEGTDGEQPPQEPLYDGFGEEPAIVNGDMFPESNGPTDSYAAIAQVDQLRQEPESLRKWREEQKDRLEELDSASKTAEAEWKEKAKKELEEWHVHQNEQMEKNKANNRASEEALMAESDGGDTGALGTEWERVARLCDFNPKTNKQAKDVSRMRSVLISLKQTPLVR